VEHSRYKREVVGSNSNRDKPQTIHSSFAKINAQYSRVFHILLKTEIPCNGRGLHVTTLNDKHRSRAVLPL
jgi:hypothetical protein